VGTDVHPH